ncbi:hypothetical protein CROQUDRAFT_707648 [Cronartium quercuum f. sp. fusiforme G11]|uniref:Uncharacterized protein n=1 Tax=Cronartium quercuum f. sp. fusiforme G11 TaxID=708437 RepID=A0A9P6TGI2_9BASI|nr:hypothetical protein CROQUDRAFT_707648 [Cronartium quercuum f. sp. fusiforme G11]
MKDFMVSAMAPNNCICFTRGRHREYTIVKDIYVFQSPLGNIEWAVLVRPVKDCFGKDLGSPSKHF